MRIDPAAVRPRFPGLSIEQDGRPVALFDGPGGTQVPDVVLDAVAGCYRSANANAGGAFLTSERSDAAVAAARAAFVDFLGASSPDEIHFGPNMTTLTFHASRMIAAATRPGDQIVVTALDHQANVDPWLAAARDHGLTVRVLDIRPDDCTLDLAALDGLLSERTRLVAVGWASNAVGTVNPVAEIVRRAHAAGALAWVDAVHWAPHGPIDVGAIDADFLVCSAYKFFGPHLGILWARAGLLESMPAYKVRPAHDLVETGTPNFEGIAGAAAAVGYLESLAALDGGGSDDAAAASMPAAGGRRARLVAAMSAVRETETALFRRLVDGLAAIPGVRMWGITEPDRDDERTPTAAITIEGRRPRSVAEALGARGIATWDGDFYATGLVERLGLADAGGLLRIGLVHYNTVEEVERLLDALAAIVRSGERA